MVVCIVQSRVSLAKGDVVRDDRVTLTESCKVLEKERKGVKRECQLVHTRKERKGREKTGRVGEGRRQIRTSKPRTIEEEWLLGHVTEPAQGERCVKL